MNKRYIIKEILEVIGNSLIGFIFWTCIILLGVSIYILNH